MGPSHEHEHIRGQDKTKDGRAYNVAAESGKYRPPQCVLYAVCAKVALRAQDVHRYPKAARVVPTALSRRASRSQWAAKATPETSGWGAGGKVSPAPGAVFALGVEIQAQWSRPKEVREESGFGLAQIEPWQVYTVDKSPEPKLLEELKVPAAPKKKPEPRGSGAGSGPPAPSAGSLEQPKAAQDSGKAQGPPFLHQQRIRGTPEGERAGAGNSS